MTLPVPHGAVAAGAGEPAGWRGPSDAGERPGIEADVRQLLLQRRQMAVLYEAEHIQQAQHGERLTEVAASTDTSLSIQA